MFKISVIIPVYNVERYLRQCLDSVINQTLREIEIICVDDASTDKSLEILREYSRKDERIRVAFFESNQGTAEARQEGVRLAESEYVLFLDPDDYLEPETCEELYQKAAAEQVDILHFSSKVENCADLSEERIREIQERLKPKGRRLKGEKVFSECFLKKSYDFYIWNKLIRTELCKRAFSKMIKAYLPKAQDLYAYFAIAYFADSYLGWQSKCYHHYCYGRGISESTTTLNKLHRFCTQADIVKALKLFCQEQHIDDADIFKKICQYQELWAKECITIWYDLAATSQAEEATEILFRFWDAETIISIMTNEYWDSKGLIADRIGRIPGDDLSSKKIRTVGVYYYDYALGGVRRVLSLLTPILKKMGFQVVFITDKEPTKDDFIWSDDVPRFTVQEAIKTNQNNYTQRMENWKQIIENSNIDLILYNAWFSNMLLWDMLYLKSQNVSVIVHIHTVFSYSLLKLEKSFAEQPKIFGLADGIVTLSEVDRTFWSAYNDRVWMLPNPIDPQLRETVKTDGAAPIITWIGRLDSQQKQPREALQIMKLVAKSRPDAVLYMIGDGQRENRPELYQKMAEEMGIEKQVKFLGYQSNVYQFLQKSSVNLLTSVVEGYPMVLIEAVAHGVPSVMYRISYLEMCREEFGVTAVNQGDRRGAAAAITSLLNDRALWEENHQCACRSFEKLAEYDFAGEWQKVLSGNCPPSDLSRAERELVHTITDYYAIGWNYAKEERNKALEATFDHRIRAFITFIPRKIRGAVRCLNENGLRYTWRRLLVHLGLKKDPYKSES